MIQKKIKIRKRNGNNLKITGKDFKSIRKLKKRVLEKFPDAEFILYGSKVRGDNEGFSDIDILILMNRKVDKNVEEVISAIAYDIDLEYDVVLSTIVESNKFWNSPLSKAMPFHWNVDKDGIII